MTRNLTFVMLALLTSLCTMTAAQDYEILIRRPFRAGQKYRLTASASQSEKTVLTVGGNVAENKTESFAFEIVADIGVLEVGKSGRPIKESLAIEKCILTKEGTATPLVPKGTVIVALVRDKKAVFEIGGQPVGEELEKALELAVSLDTGGTDDEVFGTPERKKVGDSWPINADVAARSLGEITSPLNKENIKGATKLEEVIKVGQEECVVLTAWLNVVGLAPAMPPAFKVQKGELQAEFWGQFPVKTSLGPLEKSQKMTMSVTASGRPSPNDPEVTIDMTQTRSLTSKFSYPR